ncbi:helix-turn-helix domain-containing protein [Caldimonas tepidiphila]|uniref:helix-turn-helix domain-containing protein n=1 Tax=Caldimonas tepidiphila TaxID=2315841 RepID=UPI000E5AEF14|nr:XRE family transcriptional regulator [Caldimonas tepidiphila]
MSEFIGTNLRLARLFHGLSLADLGERLGCSKQFLSRLEAGGEPVSSPLEQSMAEELQVLPEFFYHIDPMPISEEQCHFRKQLTTKVSLRQEARARGEMLKRLVCVLESHLELPPYSIDSAEPTSAEAIERAAESCRVKWGLGMGPIANVTRVSEKVGAVVMHVSGLANEVDAISFATRRPVIALNSSGRSVCRSRFGIAHELGHLALHTGVLTGDKYTENEANRFASAFLLPRSSFSFECKIALRGSRLNWNGLSELKMRWGVSKAAILYRGRQLDIFSEDQVRAGYIGLSRHGEAIQETEDHLIPPEKPEVIQDGLKVMNEHLGMPEAAIARAMYVQPKFLHELLNCSPTLKTTNVINLFERQPIAS